MTPQQCAVVFDWNGTLIADTRLCWHATNEVISAIGTPPVSLARFQKEYRIPLKSFYLRLGCDPKTIDEQTDAIFERFGKHYRAGSGRLRLRRGARQLLDHLHNSGHRASILSNHELPIITGQISRLDVHHYFDEILANSSAEIQNIMNKADKGSRLKSYVDKHDIRKALVVGDSAEEVEIAHRYGFLGVCIKGGFCSTDRLRAVNPDFLISSLAELTDITRKVFGTEGKS